MTGLNTFDLNNWEVGSGGEWLNWSVDAGNFVEVASNAPICTTDVKETEGESMFVYPNPSEAFVRIEFNSSGSRSVVLHDLQGRVVCSTQTVQAELKVDTSNLPSGVYQLNVIAQNEAINSYIIKN